jgi:hypothetical protein
MTISFKNQFLNPVMFSKELLPIRKFLDGIKNIYAIVCLFFIMIMANLSSFTYFYSWAMTVLGMLFQEGGEGLTSFLYIGQTM